MTGNFDGILICSDFDGTVFTLLDEKHESSNSNFFEIGVFLVSDKD